MGYEDFVEGLKPEVAENGKDVLYRVEDGIFKKICSQKEKPDFEQQYQLLQNLLKRRIKIWDKNRSFTFYGNTQLKW